MSLRGVSAVMASLRIVSTMSVTMSKGLVEEPLVLVYS
jgi:hypothetical protein